MNILIKMEDGSEIEVESGLQVNDLDKPESDIPFIGAMVNNDVSSLSYPLTVNSEVRFLTMADPHGWRIYRRSLAFLLAQTVKVVFPESVFSVDHSVGGGLYCSFRQTKSSPEGVTSEQVTMIEKRMREFVAEAMPIERRKIAYADAVKYLNKTGQEDKMSLLRHRNPPRVVIHWCDGFYDLAHGPLVPNTGLLDKFELIPYETGLVLHLPDRSDPDTIPPFEENPHLFRIFQEHKEWGRIIGAGTVGRLNEIITGGGMGDLIRTIEALHEKKLASIADSIAQGKESIKLILVAGPSCAGKTTFAKRLTTHLMVNGIKPIIMATDDYFVGDAENPVGEDGKPDYEHIEAVDLELFNNDLLRLVAGEEVDLPRFNFETKQREYNGRRLKIEAGQMIIIEGIHGLNPRLTEKVPSDCEFKIYVNALTQLSIDSNNRISTTDNRLMRRIIRDHNFRGHSTLETLQLWSNVRKGEKRWIFPFQREAHATFNSALDYELAVLKPLVEPLLMQVKPYDKEYAEARRLSEFLLNFHAASSEPVPHTSILREYIGGSDFKY